MSTTAAPFAFCPRCRAPDPVFEGKRLHCRDCHFVYFHNAATTVGAVIRVGREVLMTRRARDPAAGLLDFPGGFVDPGESMEQALSRELHEELALALDVAEARYLYSNANPHYVHGGVRYTTCDAYFLFELPARPPLRVADDVAGTVWIAPEAVTDSALAFDCVREIVGRLKALPPALT